jgi:O-antigen ligase
MSAVGERRGATLRRPGAVGTATPLGGDWPHTGRVMPWTVAALLAMIYLVPFDSITLPVHLPVDSKLDRFVLGFAFLLWVMVALGGTARPRLVRSPVNAAILIFLLVCILSIGFNLHSLAWDGELSLSVKQLSLAASYVVLFYICATSVRRSEVPAFAKLLVGLACLTAIGTIYQYRTGTDPFFTISSAVLGGSHVASASSVTAAAAQTSASARPLVTGPAQHGLADTTLMCVALPFALVFARAASRRRGQALWSAAGVLLLAGSFSTGRKSALLVPLASYIVLVMYDRRHLRFLPYAVVLGGVASAILPHAISHLVFQLTHASSSSSTATRTSDYPAVVPYILSHLIIGRGYGSFDPHKYRILDDQMLGWLIEIGVVGAIAYLGLMVATVATVWRVARSGAAAERALSQAVVAVTAGFFLSNFFYDTFGFRQAPYAFFFVAALGVAMVARQPGAPDDAPTAVLEL